MKRNLVRNSDGSLTLEAALVMPIFLLFTVFLATMIRIAVADMALKQSVSETTEVIATHAYPAALAEAEMRGALDSFIKNQTEEEFSLSEAEDLLGTAFEAFDIDLHGYLEQVAGDGPVRNMVVSKFEQANPDPFFSSDRIEVDILESPSSLSSSNSPLFGISATYDLGIQAPFIDRTITLEQRAFERMWVGTD